MLGTLRAFTTLRAGAGSVAAVVMAAVTGAGASALGQVMVGPGSAVGQRAVALTGSSVPPPAAALVCGNPHQLSGPSEPPAAAVRVPAGNDGKMTFSKPHMTYWFASGLHTLGGGKFGQIIPGNGDSYIGAPGAVLSGRQVNLYAFTQHASDVTIEYLTIENFGKPGDNATQGVVNHTSGHAWTIEHDTVEHNGGAGVMLGTKDVLSHDCLTENGQYGFSAYSTTGAVRSLTVTDNEVSHNNTHKWTVVDPGCGCSGGAKFWDTRGAVVTDNYIHDNRSVGLWVDTDNAGFDISYNDITGNTAEGLIYEVSYNALISHNEFVDNGWGTGPTLGFPETAIYISESGGDTRVPGPYSGTFDIVDNDLVDNWGGVVLWENSNRFCSDGTDGSCTLVDPRVYTVASCHAHLRTASATSTPGFVKNCRWRTMNVRVADNTFRFTPRVIGPSCTMAHNCGFNGLFSEYGTVSPYKGWLVPLDISDRQRNVFTDNRYIGPWRFEGFVLGNDMNWAQWTHGVKDVESSGDRFHPQDAGSTYHR